MRVPEISLGYGLLAQNKHDLCRYYKYTERHKQTQYLPAFTVSFMVVPSVRAWEFRVQLPKITPHICRHTYCSNQAKAGMNPKTLQYLMGHSDIGVTMNTYTHLGLDDAKNEMIRMEELEQARKEVDKAEDKKPMKQNMFKVV